MPQVQAGVLVYEGFDYDLGSNLASQNGGLGWGGAWNLDGSIGGDTGMEAGWEIDGVTSSGNAWRMDNYVSGTIKRTMSQSFGIVGGVATHDEIWFSTMVLHGKNSFDYDLNLSDSTDTSRVHILGPESDAGGIIRVVVQGSSWDSGILGAPGIPYTYDGGPTYLLMKYSFVPGNLTTVDTWIFGVGESIPQTEGLLPTDAAHYHQFTGVNDFSFDRFDVGGYSYEPTQIDEIRVGEMLRDSLHGMPVPEPASLMFFVFGAGLLSRVWRLRTAK